MIPLILFAAVAAFALKNKADKTTSNQATQEGPADYKASLFQVGAQEAPIWNVLNEAVAVGFKPAAVRKLAGEIVAYQQGKTTLDYFANESKSYLDKNMPKTAAIYLRVYDLLRASGAR